MVKTKKLMALAAVGALTLAACGSDDDGDSAPAETSASSETTAETESTEMTESTESTTETTEATETTEGGGEASGTEYVVDTSLCDDPDAATAPIETLKIGTSIPLSGGPAVLFAPFGEGQQAFIDWYNAENGGLDGTPVELVVKDDQYTADLTKANVDELVFDDGVTMLSGVIGSANNLAIQADMNAQCIPQLWASTGAPNWGNVEEYPWTTGLLVPYAIESRIWADYITDELGEGSTAALFYVNNEFGQAYVDAFTEIADEKGIDIVAQETIDPADSGAPSGQMTNLVQADPDAILAVPLGAQCIAFMTELGNAKAANPDFAPAVYQTATCANPLFFGATTNGGADGVFTSTNVKQVDSPEYADDADVQAYLEAMATYAPDTKAGDLTALAGWLSMALAVHVAEEALAAGDYTRAGIINAARNIDYVSPLALPGGVGQMNAEDGFYAEATGLEQWSDAAAAFERIGDIVDYNGTLGTYTP